MKKLILAISMLGLFLISCEKQDQKPAFDENTLPERLKFEIFNLNNYSERGNKPILRVEWDEWGRAKKDCDGWGLCNATWTWFPPEEKSIHITAPVYSTIVQYDLNQNKYYIDILLSEMVPADIPIDLYPLAIDQSFTLYTSSVIGTDLIFNTGEYPYDSSLGTHGGFRIYFN